MVVDKGRDREICMYENMIEEINNVDQDGLEIQVPMTINIKVYMSFPMSGSMPGVMYLLFLE